MGEAFNELPSIRTARSVLDLCLAVPENPRSDPWTHTQS
jgi:hypothetical protein